MKLHKIVFAFIFTLALSVSAFSDCGTLPPCQPPPDGPFNVGVDCCDEVTVPFDGGVSLLIAAGLGIGAASIYKKKKKAY